MLGEPHVEAAAQKGVGESVPVDYRADKHNGARQYCGEPHSHLVEYDTGEYQKEYKHVQEGL